MQNCFVASRTVPKGATPPSVFRAINKLAHTMREHRACFEERVLPAVRHSKTIHLLRHLLRGQSKPLNFARTSRPNTHSHTRPPTRFQHPNPHPRPHLLREVRVPVVKRGQRRPVRRRHVPQNRGKLVTHEVVVGGKVNEASPFARCEDREHRQSCLHGRVADNPTAIHASG